MTNTKPNKPLRPMLAVPIPQDHALPFPGYVSPKVDGIRCLITEHGPMSRTLISIPNEYVRERLSDPALIGLDGELVVGEPYLKTTFQTSSSLLMTEEGRPNFRFFVFDYWNDGATETPFSQRLLNVRQKVDALNHPNIEVLPQYLVNSMTEIETVEQLCLDSGYEGAIFRKHDGPYKYGRSTLKQGWMLKLKRFVDAEAVVVGCTELMINGNELQTNNVGGAKRSTAKDGLIPGDTLGALIVRDLKDGREFQIGSGFTDAQRKEIWTDFGKFFKQIVVYKHFPKGAKDKPRHPIFKGFRYD